MAGKRKRASFSKRGTAGNFYKSQRGRAMTGSKRYKVTRRGGLQAVSARVSALNRMIETKEGTWKTGPNAALPHNTVNILNTSAGGPLNPFQSNQGAGDPMQANNMNRIGDKITVKGVKIVAFFENALQRAKVFYRIMLVKAARGMTIDRTSLFKNDSDNKMIDCVNTEKFTIVWQRRFTVDSSNNTAATIGLTGVPATGTPGGIGTKIINAWIPGGKFGRGGNLQYEDSTGTDIKFFDYRVVVLAYDWYGTPQDVNVVGRINELYTKCYFKDA